MALRAAYCDVDGTLTATTIVTPLIWYKRRLLSPAAYKMWLASLLFRGPWWLLLDRVNRGASNRSIYQQYRGIRGADARMIREACLQQCIWPRLFPKASSFLADMRAQGIKIVFVTGGLDFIMQPLADRFEADCIAPKLIESGGVFTGELDRPPLAGSYKADALRAHAAEHGIDLSQSLALGDAYSDLQMLECVGQPVAVNPDARLKQAAAGRGWKCENWKG
ncbi:MAG TPA: HAD-IB family hydrolase [Planctomycetota bacterium]|nr:HAD-IB family hydrolase [Planctomycetota bacterium]